MAGWPVLCHWPSPSLSLSLKNSSLKKWPASRRGKNINFSLKCQEFRVLFFAGLIKIAVSKGARNVTTGLLLREVVNRERKNIHDMAEWKSNDWTVCWTWIVRSWGPAFCMREKKPRTARGVDIKPALKSINRTARQDRKAILGEISPIFRSFSANFLHMVPHGVPFFHPHVYELNLFLPIFCLKWYPILVINSSMVPICCFSAHMFTDSAYFPSMFHSFSAYFLPIFRLTFRPFLPVLSSISRGTKMLNILKKR